MKDIKFFDSTLLSIVVRVLSQLLGVPQRLHLRDDLLRLDHTRHVPHCLRLQIGLTPNLLADQRVDEPIVLLPRPRARAAIDSRL